jgi:ubiquinone biosynthesis protein
VLSMNALTVLFFVTAIALTGILLAFGVRRLLGRRLPLPRTLIAGVGACSLAVPVISSTMRRNSDLVPALRSGLLGSAVALLAGMAFLVVAEVFVPSGSVRGPLSVAQGLRGRVARTRRYSQISAILVRRGLAPYLRGRRRRDTRTAEGRARLARSVRLALEDGGVTYVKLGQVLANRSDLLTRELVEELNGLQDDVSPVAWPMIDEIIRTELGAGVDELFATFDRSPIAAASIAQVHAATLWSGRHVVVKVCRPDAQAGVESDLGILERLAVRVQRSTRWGRSMGAVALAGGLADSLREELDLRVEARNMTQIAAASARRGDNGVRIPAPIESMSTARVLVMDRLEGRAMSTIDQDALPSNRKDLARNLFESLLRGVVVDGVFHADPHPGNVFLLTDGHVGLLDFGSVGRIDTRMRVALQRLFLAVDRNDPAMLTDALLEIVERPDVLDEDQLHRSLGRFLARHVTPGLTIDRRIFTDLFRVVFEHGLSVPAELTMVFRALVTVEGTLTRLSPGFDIVAETRRFAALYLTEQLHPHAVGAVLTDELVASMPMLLRLPRRIDRIGAALESGRLGVNVRLLADDRDRHYLTDLVHLVVLTVLAATTGIMAVLILGLRAGPHVAGTLALYQCLGYGLLVVAAVLALRVLLAVLRPTPS